MEEPTVVAEEETTEEQAGITEEVTEEVVEESVEIPVTEEIVEEPRKQTAQERINEITRSRREAERETEYWKNLAMKDAPEVQATPSGRPVLHEYETTEEYEDALNGWYNQERSKSQSAIAQQEHTKTLLKSFNERAATIRAEHTDFDDVVESRVFTDTMRAVVLSAKNGPEVAYFLGSDENKAIANKIAGLPPEMQPYEIGKLETQIELTKKTKAVTTAPAPISEIDGATGGDKVDPSKMSTDEWMEWNKQNDIEKIRLKLGG